MTGDAHKPAIRLSGHDGKAIDPASGPIWKAMVDTLAALGHHAERREVGTATALGGLIALNHVPTVIEEANQVGVPVDRRTLVLFEPRITDPVAHSHQTLAQYGRVLSPTPNWPHSGTESIFTWPQDPMPSQAENLEIWRRRSKSAAIVQWNKFSAVSGERYSLRRRVIARAHSSGVPLDLVGPQWDSPTRTALRIWSGSARSALTAGLVPDLSGLRCPHPPLHRYRGRAEDKLATVSRHRVCICIENSGDYVSEKLFDAIRAQTLPVYVGPDALLPDAMRRVVVTVPPDPREIVERTAELLSIPTEDQYDQMTAILDATRQMDDQRSPLAVYPAIARIAVSHWTTA